VTREKVKTINVTAEWHSVHEVEVPDDWRQGDALPAEAMDQITAEGVELVDWETAERR